MNAAIGFLSPLSGRRVMWMSVVAVALTLSALPALSQTKAEDPEAWPTKPVKFLVPFAAGGATDIVARLLAAALDPMLGQRVIVENRVGANGAIGAQAVSKAPPDGYTVLVGAIGTQAVNEYLYSKLPYDPVKDFAPVTVLTKTNTVLTVSTNSPFKSLGELIQYAKQNPGKLNYAIPAVGDAGHLAFELLKYEANIPAVGIPYTGVPAAITDVIAGRIDLVVTAVVAQHALITAGKLRPLAVTGDARSPALPDVPTMAEAGYPNVVANSWSGLFMPAGTPPFIVNKLSATVANVYQQPEFLAKMKARGFELASLPPKEFTEYVAAQRAKWSKVIRDAKIKVEQ
jgi:tripartite-type tricarboxylate transporter receptor subunit TctC